MYTYFHKFLWRIQLFTLYRISNIANPLRVKDEQNPQRIEEYWMQTVE